jgi:hypothetical protein
VVDGHIAIVRRSFTSFLHHVHYASNRISIRAIRYNSRGDVLRPASRLEMSPYSRQAQGVRVDIRGAHGPSKSRLRDHSDFCSVCHKT